MIIMYNKHKYLQKYLTKVLTCFCLLTGPLTSGTLPVLSPLCTQGTLQSHRYSVRQCVWRLGQGTNLSEVPKVHSQAERHRSTIVYMGQPEASDRSFSEAARPLNLQPDAPEASEWGGQKACLFEKEEKVQDPSQWWLLLSHLFSQT